jgi:hypothetical protein
MFPNTFYVGLDLGQRQDHSAIALVERVQQNSKTVLYAVRGVERVALGTPYPKVVERVRGILGSWELQGRSSLVVDATGVGAPVVDALKASLLGTEITAVTITGGERAAENRSSYGIQRWNVPKRDLVAGVQMLLERGELRIAKEMRQAGALLKELLDMRVMAKATGKVRIGAEGAGEHDDLAIALALACWKAQRARGISLGGGRLPGM